MIASQFFCNCAKETLRADLVDATGTVRLLLSVWSGCREMRLSGSHYLRVQLLCCCQHESKTRSVAKLFSNLEKVTKWNRHRNENVPTSLMLMQLTSCELVEFPRIIEHIEFPRRIISMRFIAELANTFRLIV